MRHTPRDETERALSAIRLMVAGWSRATRSAFSYRRQDGVEVRVEWSDDARVHIALRDARGGGFRSSVECGQGMASVVDELVAQQDRICAARAGDSVRALTRAGARLVAMAVLTVH